MTDDGIHAFLREAGWGDADAAPLAGDASARRYWRARRPDGSTAVAMAAPPDGSTARFAGIAAHLRGLGFSAPRILWGDPEGDRLLLEDLGDALLARLVAADPAAEQELYRAATLMLADLHRHPAPDVVATPDAAQLAALTAPAADWYLGHGTPRPEAAARLAEALIPALAVAMRGPRVLVHRDFHAENLVWLPGRSGSARLGLLDFQDAFAGPPGYDLASLLDDARRDLGPGTRAGIVALYAEATATPRPALDAALAPLGAQRNLRILGIFARLSLRDGKPRYLDMLPRVWGHLQASLAHPALEGLRTQVADLLPPPDSDLLNGLRQRCGTIPTP